MARDHAVLRTLPRGELARRTGCNAETIRYYEAIGLLPMPPRTPGGHRAYGTTHEQRLRFVLRARELGFRIDSIRGLLGLSGRRAVACVEVQGITMRHLADVRARIADLRRLERTLATTVAQCSGDEVPDCPVIKALVGGSPPASTPAATKARRGGK